MRQVRDHVVRIDDLDVVRGLDVRCEDRAFAVLAQAQRDFVAVVELEHHALEIQQDVDDIFLHAVDRRVLMQNASDRDFGGRVADHGRQQNATQRVAERVAVAALERLERDLGLVGGKLLDLDGLGFQQGGLHADFLSIPPARYTGKAGEAPDPQQSAEQEREQQYQSPAGARTRRRVEKINANTVRRSAIR
ncbi:hypothetical protein D3C72_1572520 [compost metagenome]